MPTGVIRAQLHEEYNQLSTFELCILAQELVQETINKSAEVAQNARAIITLLLNQDQSIFMQKKARIEELLNGFETLLLRLRVAGAIINQRKVDKEKERVENIGATDALVAKREMMERLSAEKSELAKQVKLKNDYLKYSIDKISDIIWQINAMQTLKH